MPLIKSCSKSARKTNVREMIDAGHPPKQAIAASYSACKRSKKRGGK